MKTANTQQWHTTNATYLPGWIGILLKYSSRGTRKEKNNPSRVRYCKSLSSRARGEETGEISLQLTFSAWLKLKERLASIFGDVPLKGEGRGGGGNHYPSLVTVGRLLRWDGRLRLWKSFATARQSSAISASSIPVLTDSSRVHFALARWSFRCCTFPWGGGAVLRCQGVGFAAGWPSRGG